MIKIVVDTQEELNIVRRVLKTEACSHYTCHAEHTSTDCNECVVNYCAHSVKLYQREVVEEPCPLVV